jgi:catechol 2,3-dioxygenase-like lactoylglutathione lyase family enzyme
MTLNHLHFASAEPEKTRAFYEIYFGFRVSRRLRGTTVLANPAGFVLAIDDRAGERPPCGPRDRLHFGFCLESPQAVTALYETMKAGTVAAAPLVRIGENALHFYCDDPAGNRIEVGWFRGLGFPGEGGK